MNQATANWFAVYTKPRQERLALEHLCRQNFECFLPMAENPYQRRSKRHSVRIEPLFPRYLFLKAIPEHHNLAPVRSTRGVVTMVRAGTQLVVVQPEIIQALRARQNPSTGLIRLSPVDVAPGARVRVFDGALAGIEGLFQASCGESRAVLLIELMGRQTTVTVDRLLLQKTG
jgi:transcriptional antiterminator RfaH